mgnify:CR=1 FL=1
MKIVVVGLGYVGMSNAVLLAKRNEVIGVDLDNNKVQLVNARKSPIVDDELSQFLNKQDLENFKLDKNQQTGFELSDSQKDRLLDLFDDKEKNEILENWKKEFPIWNTIHLSIF